MCAHIVVSGDSRRVSATVVQRYWSGSIALVGAPGQTDSVERTYPGTDGPGGHDPRRFRVTLLRTQSMVDSVARSRTETGFVAIPYQTVGGTTRARVSVRVDRPGLPVHFEIEGQYKSNVFLPKISQ